ncbi:MAG: nitroreductase/quinone reductase family protein, partial [Streptosporangiaceae bacterium]
MPIEGEYVPSPRGWVRDQVERFEGSGGTEGTMLGESDMPVVIVTNKGAKTGKVRKTPLMRVE